MTNQSISELIYDVIFRPRSVHRQQISINTPSPNEARLSPKPNPTHQKPNEKPLSTDHKPRDIFPKSIQTVFTFDGTTSTKTTLGMLAILFLQINHWSLHPLLRHNINRSMYNYILPQMARCCFKSHRKQKRSAFSICNEILKQHFTLR